MAPDDSMNIILVGKRHGKSRAVPINLPVALGVLLLIVALLAVAGWSGYRVALSEASAKQPTNTELVSEWQARLDDQKAELAQVRQNVRQHVDALTLRLGEMQGRLLRLDALGQRFVESGVVASDEFDFSQPAAVGGPEESLSGDSYTAPELTDIIDGLSRRIEDREHQLRMLDIVSSQKKLEDQLYVEGRPITWGWLSSKYGYRSDPFTGKRAWHSGVDLAGREGSDIISVAAGVVTYSGERYGYGNLVEVDHGDGLRTRYAHCKTLKVKVGQVVKKGQVLALMGSTGRSTGPHVHFEVLQNGKSENPVTYIRRASR
jgi:murein DD-endopeptidase MepM/ murein hydrolase activator NlpD